MKAAFLALLFAATYWPLHAATNLTLTVDGQTYEQVEFGRVTSSTVTIQHRTGIATLPLAKLPPDLQKRFGYDPPKAVAIAPPVQAAAADAAKESDPVESFKQLVSTFPTKGVFVSKTPYNISHVTFDVKKTTSMVNPIIGVLDFAISFDGPYAVTRMEFEMSFHWSGEEWVFAGLTNRENGADFANTPFGRDMMGAGPMKEFMRHVR